MKTYNNVTKKFVGDEAAKRDRRALRVEERREQLRCIDIFND